MFRYTANQFVKSQMTINREAFENAVLRHSPLKPCQIEQIFQGIDASNKQLVWDFIRCHPKGQMQVWGVLKYVPEEGKLEKLR